MKECFGSHTTCHCRTCCQKLCQPVAAFGKVIVQTPEPPQCARQAQPCCCILRSCCPIKRRPEIIMFDLEPIQTEAMLRPIQSAFELFGQRAEELQMALIGISNVAAIE